VEYLKKRQPHDTEQARSLADWFRGTVAGSRDTKRSGVKAGAAVKARVGRTRTSPSCRTPVRAGSTVASWGC